VADTANATGILGTYLQLLRGQVRGQASYRISFLIEQFANVWATAFDIVTVLVMFRVTRVLGGFDLHQSLVIAGLAASGFAAANFLAGNVVRLDFFVRTGRLDALLVRPLGVLPQLALADLQLRKVSRVVLGTAVYLVALATADIHWTPARVVLAVLAPIAGTVFFCSLFLIGATLSFWWVDSGELPNSFTYGGRDFTTYPITVYGGWFRGLFAYGMGFAFVAYYPALALLGRADPLGQPAWVGWSSPLVAPVAAGVAAAVWRFGLRHYRSTGS
jgi:ABC-2 type transport system permease protein